MNRPLVIALIALAATLPLLIPSFPPLIDLGGHLGRYAVQVDGGASADLGQWYSFRWALLPNLGVDLLVQCLAPLMGLEPAVKLIIAGSAALWATGLLLLSRAAHGRVQPTALFALPLIYALPLQYGFVNFHLAAGFALVLLALWIELGKRGKALLRGVLFVPIGFLLWLCHLVGWGIFGVVAFADGALRGRERGLVWWRAGLRSALSLVPLLAGPLAGKLLGPGGAPQALFVYDTLSSKLVWVLTILRDRWAAWDQLSVFALIALIAWFWRGKSFARHAGLGLGALLLLALYAVMPGTILDSNMADMRLVPVIMALLLVAARPSVEASARLVRNLAIAGLLFAGARLAGNAVSLAVQDAQFRQSLAVLDRVPRGANLVTFRVLRCEATLPWAVDRRTHLSGFALARRHAFDNHQWVLASGQLLKVSNPAARPFEHEHMPWIYARPCDKGQEIGAALAQVGPAIGTVWIIGMPDDFHPAGWRLVEASGDSALLRRSGE